MTAITCCERSNVVCAYPFDVRVYTYLCVPLNYYHAMLIIRRIGITSAMQPWGGTPSTQRGAAWQVLVGRQ